MTRRSRRGGVGSTVVVLVGLGALATGISSVGFAAGTAGRATAAGQRTWDFAAVGDEGRPGSGSRIPETTPERVTANLLALYTFEEGSGSTVQDRSGVAAPLDLTIQNPSSTSWLPGGGLSIDSVTGVTSPGPATKLLTAIQASQAFTVEAWVRPSNLTQFGPARIVALSQNGFPDGGNVVLGQTDDTYVVRTRTTGTNQYGSDPTLGSPAGTLTTELAQIVYTTDSSGVRSIYINGGLATSGFVGGSFASWGNYPLALANEPSLDRGWLGELHLVAFYDRNLDPSEVRQNLDAGPSIAPTIVHQPLGQSVPEGSTATFTVVGGGTGPLGYEWQQFDGADWQTIPGATQDSFTTPGTLVVDDDTDYRCILSNPLGSIVSDVATLNVIPEGAIIEIIDDGSGLSSPDGIDVDAAGNVYVSSFDNGTVYRITPQGVVTTVIGPSGDGTGNPLVQPVGLAVDDAGTVYVAGFGSLADGTGSRVFRISPLGVVTMLIGPIGDGAGNPLLGAIDVNLDGDDNAYVTGFFSSNVFKVTPLGVVTEIIDQTGDGGGNPMLNPGCIAVTTAGTVFVAGRSSNNAFEIAPGGTITQILDSTGDGTHTVSGPIGIATDGAGNVFVTGNVSDNVFKIDSMGAVTQVMDASGDGSNPLQNPTAVVIDESGNLFVAAHDSSNVFRVAPGGLITEVIDGAADGINVFDAPADDCLAVREGSVYAAGTRSDNVFRVLVGP